MSFKLNPSEDVFAQITKYAAHKGVRMSDAVKWAGADRGTVYKWRTKQPRTVSIIASLTGADFALDVSENVHDQIKEYLRAKGETIITRSARVKVSQVAMRWKNVQPKTLEIIDALITAIDLKSASDEAA